MSSTVNLVAAATTYYLNNTNGVPTRGGATTGATTTPLMIRHPWEFLLAPPSIWGAFERTPVEMTIPLICHASSHDNLMNIISTLRRAFTTQTGIPPYLAIDPDGSAQVVYYTYDVFTPQIQESPAPDSESITEGAIDAHIDITIRRSPYGAGLTSPQTMIDAQSIVNLGTGTPDNIVAFSSGAGDFVSEGGPCNYTITPSSAGAGDPIRSVFLASVLSRTYGTPTTGSWSTSNTTFDTGASATLTAALDIATMISNPHVKLRIFVRTSALTGSFEYRFKVYLASANTGVIYTAPISALQVVDSLRLPLQMNPLRELNDTDIGIQLQIRSTTGGATTGTINSWEALFYYDACEVKFPRAANAAWATGAGTYYEMHLSSFAERSGYVLMPLEYPEAFLSNPGASDALVDWGSVRGVVPRLRPSTSLYVMFRDASSATSAEQGLFSWNAARTGAVTATHSGLYRTLRGNE